LIADTPTYSSWLNQVERLFAYVTADLLQRSDHRSVQALEKDLREWVKAWNENPRPFVWTKTADQILGSLGRLLQRSTGAGH
jgi:transposase